MNPPVEERLARLEARLAIEDLKARYAALVDSRTRRGQPLPPGELAEVGRQVAELFTADAVWDGGAALGVATGRDEIAARLREPTVGFAQHVFSQPRITIDPGLRTATGQWSLVCPCTRQDGASYWMLGEEHDRYALVEGEWLHAAMRLRVIAMAPVPDGFGRIFD